MERYVWKDKKQNVISILQKYAAEKSHSSKAIVFEKIHRFMPFDNYEFLHMDKLKTTLKKALTQPTQTIIFKPYQPDNSSVLTKHKSYPVITITSCSASTEFTKPQSPPKMAEFAQIPTDVTPIMSDNACMDETTNSIIS